MTDRAAIPVKEASWIDNSHGWHAIENVANGLAVSLHCYVPGYQRCKIINNQTGKIMEVILVGGRNIGSVLISSERTSECLDQQ